MPYPAQARLHDLIAAQCRRTPDAVALTYEETSLTYAQLDRRSAALAARLRQLGVGPNTLVGVCMLRSLELIVGLLAVLRAGGAYVPMDPEYPRDRLAFMLEDTRAPLLLTQSDLLANLPGHDAHTICVDRWEASDEGWEAVIDDPAATADDAAYVIYTSGSTGKPKGVINTHRGICNQLLWAQDALPLVSGDVVPQKTPVSFDVSVWEMFWPLIAGARLVITRPGGHRDPAYLARLIETERVTVMHFVPSLLRLFLDEVDVAKRCGSLRHVICSGEALPWDLRERFFARLDATLRNWYGPTEAAVHVTHWTCRRDDHQRVVPIGRPVANTRIYVLDDAGQPVPVGNAGELYIGGVQVAHGYLNRPDLTAERFLPDPFANEPSARMYRTGDRARYRSDGVVEFLGRLDDQVKIRGFRVELGEIESAMRTHPAVRQAAVVAWEGDGEDARLVAYVVPANGMRALSDLRDRVARALPDYMVPSAFVVLDALPLSPNGKVDRRALPPVETNRPNIAQPYAAPRTPLERFLTGLWAQILRLDCVGIHDPFFELGGTSLQAARFVNRLQEELGEVVSVVTVFSAPTVAAYAQLLEREYPTAVARRLATVAQAAAGARAADRRIDLAAVAKFRRCIPVLEARTAPPPVPRKAKNPPAIFILAPPRSGTTLLRVMLAGHPKLFAAAELQLLGFDTMGQRRTAYAGRFSAWLEGAVRAVMELRGCGPQEARRIIEGFEHRDASTSDFYGTLQEWLGGRTLVDKSPSYALDPNCLRKAERDFEGPLYVHLLRHPAAMVRSFEEYHLDQVLYVGPHDFTARELGELVWLVSHRNILDFLRDVPRVRQFGLRFEHLVMEPRGSMEELCRHFGLPFDEETIQPYRNLDRKMIDGVYPESAPMGDRKFLARRQIDSAVATTGWGRADADALSELTWELATGLGYERSQGGESVDRSVQRATRAAGQRARRMRSRGRAEDS